VRRDFTVSLGFPLCGSVPTAAVRSSLSLSLSLSPTRVAIVYAGHHGNGCRGRQRAAALIHTAVHSPQTRRRQTGRVRENRLVVRCVTVDLLACLPQSAADKPCGRSYVVSPDDRSLIMSPSHPQMPHSAAAVQPE